MINKELKNEYKVKWDSDVFEPHNTESMFSYSSSERLADVFKMVCNIILNSIANSGNYAEVNMYEAWNGVKITERLPNGENIKHFVWIEKAN